MGGPASRAKLHLLLPCCSHYRLSHPPTPNPWKNCLPQKPVPGAKKVGDRCSRQKKKTRAKTLDALCVCGKTRLASVAEASE